MVTLADNLAGVLADVQVGEVEDGDVVSAFPAGELSDGEGSGEMSCGELGSLFMR